MRKLLTIILLGVSLLVTAQEDEVFSPINEEGLIETPTRFIPYYQKPGAINLTLSNHMFLLKRTRSMPLNLGVEISAFKNFTFGPIATYHRFSKTSIQQKSSHGELVVWENTDIKYNEFMFGLKGSYHLLPVIEKIVRKDLMRQYLDIYISPWVGVSTTRSSHPEADTDVERANSTIRGGIMAGARSYVLPRWAFFVEVGYNSYSYGSFGTAIRLK